MSFEARRGSEVVDPPHGVHLSPELRLVVRRRCAVVILTSGSVGAVAAPPRREPIPSSLHSSQVEPPVDFHRPYTLSAVTRSPAPRLERRDDVRDPARRLPRHARQPDPFVRGSRAVDGCACRTRAQAARPDRNGTTAVRPSPALNIGPSSTAGNSCRWSFLIQPSEDVVNLLGVVPHAVGVEVRRPRRRR